MVFKKTYYNRKVKSIARIFGTQTCLTNMDTQNCHVDFGSYLFQSIILVSMLVLIER